RRRLGEKDAKGAQGGILDGIAGVGTLLAMVRQLRGPSVQDVLEDLEAQRSLHDDLLRSIEIVTLPMSVSIGNVKPFAGQNENCCVSPLCHQVLYADETQWGEHIAIG